MRNSGFWVPILPGAFAGLACGQLSSVRSWPRGVANGVVALLITIYAQFKLWNPPFDFDGTFFGYLGHLGELPALTLLLIVVNGLIAAWWGREERMGSGRIKPRPASDAREL